MKVRDRMTPDPVTVAPDASVDMALGIMRDNVVRHLPVVENGVLKGLVTDTDLSTAWFPSLLEEVTVKDVMNSNPHVIDADDTVYQAARLIYTQKLTGLLVLDGDRLVGIITLADLIELFIGLLGVLNESSRLDVTMKPGPAALEEVHATISRLGGEVVSVALLPGQPPRRTYSFRLEKTDLKPIAEALAAQGFEVAAD